ncbi:MAG TPA: Tm-1-like ATP-binding domain-containing protein [Glaciibacter sp.]|nr:Tm-1-like ATP-binding domain-containing protein [Glaciibacter sp.]
MTNPVIAVIGTLDTKGAEIDFVRARLAKLDAGALVIDSGILGTPGITADIPREQVAEAAGTTLPEVQNAGSRGAAVELMQEGLRVLVRGLYDDGRIQGVLCLGGAEGGLMGAAAMQALPVGVPKIVVSPSASGRREFGPFMGSSDILVMHSVIDILGLNSVARSVFGNAAAAMVGMCRWGAETPASDRPSIGLTMLGQTTPGAMVIAKRLEEAGYEPIIFHANGVGGPAMDAMARDGVLSGVIDFTLSEVSNTMFDGVHATGPDRMRAAVECGLPLLVVPGSLDFFNQGALDTVPDEYRKRPHYKHNPVATLVRVNEEEMRALGRQIAERISTATAPTTVMVPTRGLSLIGVPGGPISDARADAAVIDGLRESLPASIPLEVFDTDINSAEFGNAVAERFLGMLAQSARSRSSSRAYPKSHSGE